MWRVENTVICNLVLTVPQFLVFLPFQAFFKHGLWIILVQLAALLILVQPINFCELALGQRSQKGPLKCWCFGPAWKGIGFLMLVTTGWEIVLTNMDILEYLRQKNVDYLLYGQLIAWVILAVILIAWPQVTGKLWILVSLVCFGGIVAIAARSLTLSATQESLVRLWKLSSHLPSDILDLLRISLLPFLSSTGTGVLITLGSYRSQKVNAFIDSVIMIVFIFLFHLLYTISDSALIAFYCKTNALDNDNKFKCDLDNLNCPISTLENGNFSCKFLEISNLDSPDKAIESADMFYKLLQSLPKNAISPTLWVWTWYAVLGIMYTTYIVVRVDTWVRTIADKFQGAQVFKSRTITARLISSFFTCALFGVLGFFADKYKLEFNVQKMYQLSTVRWLPILLGALTCLAVVHGYGGIRFIKEVGGGITLRPWFFVLAGFITPVLLISLGGLRMHQSIEMLLQPNSEANALSSRFNLPNYVNLILAVSAFLFLLTGLFSPLIWHGICRQQRCAQLVQPTKSWHLVHRSRSNSIESNSGGDVVRDLGPATVEETPMLNTLRHNAHHHNSNPMLVEMDNHQLNTQHFPMMQHREKDLDFYPTDTATVRFHPGNGVYSKPAGQGQYSTATLPARRTGKNELRFSMDSNEPGAMSSSKTLNRGILKNKHQANYRGIAEESIPLQTNTTHNPYLRRTVENTSTEVL